MIYDGFRFRLIGLWLCLAMVAATGAEAQAPVKDKGLELRIFRPAVDSKGLVTINSSPILPHLAVSFGLILDMAQNIYYGVELPQSQDDRTKVDTSIQGVFHANLGLANVAVLGVQVPIAIVSGTTAVGDNGQRSWSSQNVGDISVHTKLRFWRSDRHPVGLAAVFQAQFPSSDDQNLTGEPGYTTLIANGILDSEVERWLRLAFNAGVRFPIGYGDVKAQTEDLSGSPLLLAYGPELTFGAGASFQIVPQTIDLVVEYIGATVLGGDFFMPDYLPMEALAGVKVFVEHSSYLIVGGGGGIPTGGFATPMYRVFLGFIYEPSIGDRDADTIKDDIDQCPDDPEDFDGYEDTDGCPDPDNDRDGILDVDDQCPLVPEDKEGIEDEDGCPEKKVGDRDGDGLKDDVDKCPDDPEDQDGFEDADGCPDPDNDKDCIPDIRDKCPNNPEDLDGFEDTDGCPDPDNDKDGILDVRDKCPNDPETFNGYQDEDGCPDQGRVLISDTDITILDKIYFEYDSAVIKPISFPILDAVAATLKGNPQIMKIEIQGHADERGDEEYNIKLTHDRAASVMEYLISHGVERERLRSAGYGKRCPIDPEHNEAAWEKNRRVEFKILETTAGPTNVKVACDAGKDLIPKN